MTQKFFCYIKDIKYWRIYIWVQWRNSLKWRKRRLIKTALKINNQTKNKTAHKIISSIIVLLIQLIRVFLLFRFKLNRIPDMLLKPFHITFSTISFIILINIIIHFCPTLLVSPTIVLLRTYYSLCLINRLLKVSKIPKPLLPPRVISIMGFNNVVNLCVKS